MQHHSRLLAKVIKHRRGFLEKQWQVVLDARCRHTVAHVFVNTAFRWITLQQLAPAAAKLGAGGVVHRKFTARQQAHFRHRVQATLGVRVKRANGVDFVVEQIDPVRHQRAHWKQINQPATHCIFSRADHLGHMAVTRQRQLGFEFGFIKLLLDFEFKRVAG